MKNIATTTITSFIAIISMIFVTRYLAIGLGPEEFGAYSLARRIISNVIPLATLLIGYALTRYIAMTDDNKLRSSFIVSSIISNGAALLLLLLIVVPAGKYLSYLIFHSYEYLKLFYASLFFLVGYSVFNIVYAFFRGMQKFNTANSLQLCITAIIPLIVSYFFAYKKNSSFIMFLMGLAFYLAIIPLVLIIMKTGFPLIRDVKKSMKTLLKYSIPRVPGGFILAGLLTTGPFLAGLFMGLKEAGYFVVGQSPIRVMGSAIVAFGLVALPKVSQLWANNNEEFLKYRIEDILIMIFQIGLFFTIHLFLWSKEIVQVWLGTEYIDAIPIVKIIVLSLSPYIGFIILRSIIDAVEVRAINTLNLFISFVIAIITSIIFINVGLGMTGLALGTTIGYVSLGILTSNYLIKRYQIPLKNFMLRWVLVLNIFFAGIIIIIRHLIASSLREIELLIVGFILEAIIFLCYLYFFYKKDTRWFSEVKKRISPST
jgi:O-antigen/teichoic acid export membrane protein